MIDYIHSKDVLTTEARTRLLKYTNLAMVQKELESAMAKHPTGWHSAHEGYAVLLEEVDELWDEVKLSTHNTRKMRIEACQIAAMALRFLIEVVPQQVTDGPAQDSQGPADGAGFKGGGSECWPPPEPGPMLGKTHTAKLCE